MLIAPPSVAESSSASEGDAAAALQLAAPEPAAADEIDAKSDYQSAEEGDDEADAEASRALAAASASLNTAVSRWAESTGTELVRAPEPEVGTALVEAPVWVQEEHERRAEWEARWMEELRQHELQVRHAELVDS